MIIPCGTQIYAVHGGAWQLYIKCSDQIRESETGGKIKNVVLTVKLESETDNRGSHTFSISPRMRKWGEKKGANGESQRMEDV